MKNQQNNYPDLGIRIGDIVYRMCDRDVNGDPKVVPTEYGTTSPNKEGSKGMVFRINRNHRGALIVNPDVPFAGVRANSFGKLPEDLSTWLGFRVVGIRAQGGFVSCVPAIGDLKEAFDAVLDPDAASITRMKDMLLELRAHDPEAFEEVAEPVIVSTLDRWVRGDGRDDGRALLASFFSRRGELAEDVYEDLVSRFRRRMGGGRFHQFHIGVVEMVKQEEERWRAERAEREAAAKAEAEIAATSDQPPANEDTSPATEEDLAKLPARLGGAES